MKFLLRTFFVLFVVASTVFIRPPSVSAQTLPEPIVRSLSSLLNQAQHLLANDRFASVAQELILQVQEMLDAYLNESVNMFEDMDEFLALYSVTDFELEFIEGEEDEEDISMWELFLNASDKELVDQYVKHFAVYENGADDTAAYVERSLDDESWILVVNLDGISSDNENAIFENAEVLVHEFSHILSLNTGQISESIPEELCTTHFTDEGCPLVDSYYEQFTEKFWTDADIVTVNTWLEYDQEDADELLQDWYEDRSKMFVTDYAATNPGEDFAESFTYFIFELLPFGLTTSDEKIRFFYSFPELVDLRIEIRNQLGEIIDYDSSTQMKQKFSKEKSEQALIFL